MQRSKSRKREEPALMVLAITLLALASVLAWGWFAPTEPAVPPIVTDAPDISLVSPTTVYPDHPGTLEPGDP